MSDWDFLHDMHFEGYSAEQIMEAAGCGYNPWDSEVLDPDWIEEELGKREKETFISRDGFPYSHLEQINILEDLIECAKRHFENTGRYLQIWGELGEVYAETKHRLCRHGSRRAGSDGKIGDKLVEVKTISPEKNNNFVNIKKQGDFEQLLIVRIDKNFEFESKLFDRAELKVFGTKLLRGQFDSD